MRCDNCGSEIGGAFKFAASVTIFLLIALLVPGAVSAGDRRVSADQPLWVDRSIPGATAAVEAIQVKSGDPGRLCVILLGSTSLFSSQDGGSTWQAALTVPGSSFMSICESKVNAGLFFALDSSSRVYRSDDAGATWGLASTIPVVANDIDTGRSGTDLIAATGALLVNAPIHYSIDTGASWTPSSGPSFYWARAAGDPDNVDRFYAAEDAASTGPVYLSADGGSTWAPCGALPDPVHVSCLVALPNVGPVLLATDTAGVGPVYRSNNGGISWQVSSTGLSPDDQVNDLSVSNVSATVAYTAGPAGIHASYDNGTTWSDVTGNLPALGWQSVGASGGQGNAVYAGSADGRIFRQSAPLITRLTPSSGVVGDTVTISGENLGAGGSGSYVSFIGVEVAVTESWTDTAIAIKVPLDASSGDVFVVTPEGASNSLPFTLQTAPGASYTWYLAEGCTGKDGQGTFETWVLVQNPGTVSADVQFTFMTDKGSTVGPLFNVPAGSRQSLNVTDYVPNTWSVSTKLSSNQPVIAERSVYWDAAGCFRQAATDSIGVTAPAGTWYLAEGSTGYDPVAGTFETWILVQNPGSETARVRLTYMTPAGAVMGPQLNLAAGSRQSINVADTLPNCWSVSTRVTADQPIVAERSMYLDTPSRYRQAATDSIGVTAGASDWYLAEGCTGAGGDGSFETWVLVQNPGAQTATAQLTYMTSTGPVAGPSITLDPMSRKTVSVAETVPHNWSVSTRVTSDMPVIAERSMYWSAPGHTRQAATDSIGVSSARVNWCLAEGSTGKNEQGSFETWVLVQNPGSFPAMAVLTYMTSSGPVPGPTVVLPPNSRTTVNVGETVKDVWDVSTRVTANEPVVVERAMYWNAPGVPRQAATDSIGVPQ
jgi:hypothetical protein